MAVILLFTNLLCGVAGYIAAGWLGSDAAAMDLAVTGKSVEATPFYEMVFEQEPIPDLHEALLPDPETKVRPRPLFEANGRAGPHDVLGFRGEFAPIHADIITIGDSQTYGWGVALSDNWPSQLSGLSGRSVYNMALGGWGGGQYRYIIDKALRLHPKQVIVGIYMGNDSIETLQQVYQNKRFARLRLPERPSLSDFELKLKRVTPVKVALPAHEVQFTPRRRFFVNDRDSEGVLAGYRLLGDLAVELVDIARKADVAITFLLIPTKETVYAPLVQAAGKDLGDMYNKLVADERVNAAELERKLLDTGVRVVDTTELLQRALESGVQVYPLGPDGHPAPPGYRVIAEAAAAAIGGSASGGK